MQESEEPTAEAEPECGRGLGLVGEARVVEAELLQRLAQVLELVTVDRIEPTEDHGLGVAVAVERNLGRVAGMGDRLARSGFTHVLDAGDQVAGLARAELGDRLVVGGAHADLVGLVLGAGLHEAELVVGSQHTVHHPHRADHPAVLVEV